MGDTGGFVVNEVLCYINFYLHRFPTDSLKTVIAECCTEEDIVNAKRILVDFADTTHKESLKDIKDTRRDTTQRLAKFANIQDILDILRSLDEARIETPVYIAKDLDKLPRVKPDDACNMVALAKRMNRLDTQVQQLQSSAEQQADVLLAQAVFSSPQTDVNSVATPITEVIQSPQTVVKTVTTPERADHMTEQHANAGNDSDSNDGGASRNDNNDPVSDNEFVLSSEERRRMKRRERRSWPLTDSSAQPASDNVERNDTEDNRERHPRSVAIERNTDFADPSNANAKVILLCDSVPRHVKPALFFGARYAKIVKSAWASTSVKVIEKWKNNETVEFVVMHLGIRDVRDELPISDIIADTKMCMKTASRKYNNAKVLYSEVLYTTDETHNDTIREINNCIKTFCEDSDTFIYVPHKLIQETDSMFVDATHLNDGRGTRTFVKDIVSAAFKGSPRQPQSRRSASGGSNNDPPITRHAWSSNMGETNHRSAVDGGINNPPNTRQRRMSAVGGSSNDPPSTRQAWSGNAVDKYGNRDFDTSGTQDLIKLFVSLLDRM